MPWAVPKTSSKTESAAPTAACAGKTNGPPSPPCLNSIRRVKTAYQILAYERCDDDHRAAIERDLARERNWYTRDKVELTGTEAIILTALTQPRTFPQTPKGAPSCTLISGARAKARLP